MLILDRENANQVKGNWFRYEYYLNGTIVYVYMRNDKEFKHYYNYVLRLNKRYGKNGGYEYTLPKGGIKKVAMTMDEILSDQSNKVKCLLTEEFWDYIQ